MKEYRVLNIYSENLKRDVKIYVMLPKSYEKSTRSYPVLYMHDGQNLFDKATAHMNMSWGILESYEKYPDLPELIIVGIENGKEERSNELVPYTFNFREMGYPEYGEDFGGKADLYLDFIVNKLKPIIDKKYRTFKSPKNTGMMGSSFGGLNSTYAALKYQDSFSRFGCVSNAYFVVQEKIKDLIKTSDLSNIKKIYMDVGTKEDSSAINNERYVESNEEIYSLLSEKLDEKKIKFKIIKDAVHNELAWEERFPEIIKYLFND